MVKATSQGLVHYEENPRLRGVHERAARAEKEKLMEATAPTEEAAKQKKRRKSPAYQRAEGVDVIKRLLEIHGNDQHYVGSLLGVAGHTVSRWLADDEASLTAYKLAGFYVREHEASLLKLESRFDGMEPAKILEAIQMDMLDAEDKGLCDWEIVDGVLSASAATIVKKKL